MKPLAALAISATMLFAQNERASVLSVTAIRSWSLDGVTRIAVEVSGDFHFRTDRLHNPERVYYDIVDARPRIDGRRIWSREINDKLVQRVRAAEPSPGTTRIVLDLTVPVEVGVSQLSNPNRLMIELRAGTGPAIPTAPMQPAEKPPPVIKAEIPKTVVPAGKTPKGEDPTMLVLRIDVPVLKTEAGPLPNKLTTAPPLKAGAPAARSGAEIGRASCRERV